MQTVFFLFWSCTTVQQLGSLGFEGILAISLLTHKESEYYQCTLFHTFVVCNLISKIFGRKTFSYFPTAG